MICRTVVWCEEAEAHDGKRTDFREWELNNVKKALCLHSWNYPTPYSFQSCQSVFPSFSNFIWCKKEVLVWDCTCLPAAEFCSLKLSCLIQIYAHLLLISGSSIAPLLRSKSGTSQYCIQCFKSNSRDKDRGSSDFRRLLINSSAACMWWHPQQPTSWMLLETAQTGQLQLQWNWSCANVLQAELLSHRPAVP